jgi:hypothetical protein
VRDLAKSNEAASAAQGARLSEAPAEARARADAVAGTRRMESELQAQREVPRVQGVITQAAPQATPPPSTAARAAPQVKPMPDARVFGSVAALQLSPERWLEQIAELRKQGKHEEADKALAEFRKRYPDYRIPEAVLEKVEKK